MQEGTNRRLAIIEDQSCGQDDGYRDRPSRNNIHGSGNTLLILVGNLMGRIVPALAAPGNRQKM
jgi:hypothetical protein